MIRRGKGQKDRAADLPSELVQDLKRHLARVRKLHDKDLADGYGEVFLPDALDRKYPNAPKEWGWQYVFPSKNRSTDPRSGKIRRHHVYENNLQSAIRRASRRAGFTKAVHAHTLRHSFATHLLAAWASAVSTILPRTQPESQTRRPCCPHRQRQRQETGAATASGPAVSSPDEELSLWAPLRGAARLAGLRPARPACGRSAPGGRQRFPPSL